MTWTSPHTWLVLLSPSNGLLFWTPLALPALMGLVWLAIRRSPLVAGETAPAARRDCDDLSRDGHDARSMSAAHSIRGPAPARSASAASWA